MHKNKHLIAILVFSLSLPLISLAQLPLLVKDYATVTTGAQRFNEYVPMLKKKRVAIVTNITGVVGNVSIVDTLLHLGVKVVKIFGPEHGFRSNAEAGQHVKSNKDAKTGIPVISLYGNNKKPTAEQLKHVDIVIYDIQDIGVRFYTYISTLTYVMEACAENKKALIVLDRPNPNGFYVDGPVLTSRYRSFLGLHPVPIVYGMTCGEYAEMVNGEGWLGSDSAAFSVQPIGARTLSCNLTVIKMKDYDRNCSYHLPVKPSPNIPNNTAVLLYPSLGLFEGTIVGLGRGTNMPFQVIGFPSFSDTSFGFSPQPSPINKEPKYLNKRCHGLDLRYSDYINDHPRKIELRWLQRMYNDYGKDNFFEQNFNYHAGNNELQKQLKEKQNLEMIRKSWQPGLEAFKKMRVKYLLYGDFQ
jgi:uncharacterized protein YbbC (DUF1343 family)